MRGPAARSRRPRRAYSGYTHASVCHAQTDTGIYSRDCSEVRASADCRLRCDQRLWSTGADCGEAVTRSAGERAANRSAEKLDIPTRVDRWKTGGAQDPAGHPPSRALNATRRFHLICSQRTHRSGLIEFPKTRTDTGMTLSRLPPPRVPLVISGVGAPARGPSAALEALITKGLGGTHQ